MPSSTSAPSSPTTAQVSVFASIPHRFSLGTTWLFEVESTQMVDRYLEASDTDAPTEELPRLSDGFAQPIIEELDLSAAGISTVLWATGYRADFGLVKPPAFDATVYPIQENGVTTHAGLFFVGMPGCLR